MDSENPPPGAGGISRRRFLQGAAAAMGSLYLGGVAGHAPGAGSAPAGTVDPADMNIVIFMTDQERSIQHFPPGWAEQNLPGLTQLRRHGLEFTQATTSAAMCSPARSTMLTGYFPAQHGVKYTLETDMNDPSLYPQVNLPTPDVLPNLGTVMAAAGYYTVFKGKWHCSKPPNGATTEPPDMLEPYGWHRWNPQDAGANQSIPQMGGGMADNDGRYMASVGDVDEGEEGVLQFLQAWPSIRQTLPANQQKFCLIISLVNPHDVLAYPLNDDAAGYSGAWFDGDIGLPATVNEDLSTKPQAQQAFRKLSVGLGPLPRPSQKRAYLNFYGNLMRASDNYLVNVIAALKAISTSSGSTVFDQTLIIRTSDHGEMGMAHGGLRQKNFNMYEETMRVPLVFSNPTLFPRPRQSDALVSHVDLLPTLASLVRAPASATAPWAGVDYSKLILDPRARPPQDDVVFTYDDFQSGQASPPYVPPPQHVVAIRERRWKIARYHSVAPDAVAPEYEMYDLFKDPLETTNIAGRSYRRSRAEQAEFARLRRKLDAVERTRLQPLPTTVEPPMPTNPVYRGVKP